MQDCYHYRLQNIWTECSWDFKEANIKLPDESFYFLITKCLSLEGISGGHQAQHPCSFRAAYSRLPMTVYRELLKISREGGSITYVSGQPVPVLSHLHKSSVSLCSYDKQIAWQYFIFFYIPENACYHLVYVQNNHRNLIFIDASIS